MDHHVSGRRGLLEILSWARPHDSDTEQAFCREFLDRVPGMKADAFGNRMIAVGSAPRILWSCHVDTVAARGGAQEIAVSDLGIAALRHGKSGMSLGADDGAGLWIMLNMIAASRPGLYVFHRGEEHGCLGSQWIRRTTPQLLGGIDAAIAFDRAGLFDVITHQSYGRTCSDAFATSFASALNELDAGFRYRPDNSGVFTDTNEYAGLVPECTNISVGYYSQHGPKETLDLGHCEKLLGAMLRFDTAKLVIARDPSRCDDAPWSWQDELGDRDDLAALVAEHPLLAAEMLLEAGVTSDDFWLAAWERERGGGAEYRPLSSL